MSAPGIEFALMIDWGDDKGLEFIPALSPEHADEMARRLFPQSSCWTVGREVQPWRFVRRGDATLTDEVI